MPCMPTSNWLNCAVEWNTIAWDAMIPAVKDGQFDVGMDGITINDLEAQIQKLTDVELRAKTDEFRKRHAGGESLDDLQLEAFAVCREAAKRVLNMRHFDMQLIGGTVLHQGKIAEMKTGEGKTLVATLPVFP